MYESGVVSGIAILLGVLFFVVLGWAFGNEGSDKRIERGHAIYIKEREYRCAEVPSGTNRNP